MLKRTKPRGNHPKHRILAIVGWIGVVAILTAYILNNFGIIASSNPWYLILNLVGSLALLLEAYLHHDVPPIFLDAVWALIAIVGLVRFLLSS